MEEIIISHIIKKFFGSLYSNKDHAPKIQIELIKPKDLKDAQTAIDLLFEDMPVVVNFDETSEDKVKQIMDFICGTASAAGCHIEQISEEIFIFTPKNIEIKSVN